jgi:hypothetical protein
VALGVPVVVTLKVPLVLMVKLAVAPLVIFGAVDATTVNVNGNEAVAPTPLLALIVTG